MSSSSIVAVVVVILPQQHRHYSTMITTILCFCGCITKYRIRIEKVWDAFSLVEDSSTLRMIWCDYVVDQICMLAIQHRAQTICTQSCLQTVDNTLAAVGLHSRNIHDIVHTYTHHGTNLSSQRRSSRCVNTPKLAWMVKSKSLAWHRVEKGRRIKYVNEL